MYTNEKTSCETSILGNTIGLPDFAERLVIQQSRYHGWGFWGGGVKWEYKVLDVASHLLHILGCLTQQIILCPSISHLIVQCSDKKAHLVMFVQST